MIKKFEDFDWTQVKIKNQKSESVDEKKFFSCICRYQRVVFLGKQGVGKTHLARASQYSYVKERENDFEYLMPGDRRDKLQSITECIDTYDLYAVFFGLQPHLSWEQQQDARYDYRKLLRSELLIIDDLGSEKISEKELFQQGLKKLLDTYGGKLIITTNLSIKSIEDRYGMKIFSRLVEDALLLFIEAHDYRQRDLVS